METVEHLKGHVSCDSIRPYVLACLPHDRPAASHDLDNLRHIAAYLDGTYYILRQLHTQFKEIQRLSVEKPDVYYENGLNVMDLLLCPERKPSDILGQPIKPKTELARHTRISYLRHLLTQVWLSFLDNSPPDELMLKALRLLGDGRLTRLSESRLLANYVVPIFDPSTVTSAEQSTGFTVPPTWSRSLSRTVLGLVHKGGFNYPRLYPRLYQLLDVTLLQCPEAERFLDDLDIYLSSLHLACGVVAAFVKRLAQLALISPLRLTPALLLLIRNALHRHTKCSVLVNRKTLKSDGNHRMISGAPGDPYIWDPDNLQFSDALNSSLWEVASLIHHYSPVVSSLAQKICHSQATDALPDSLSPSQLIQQQDEYLSKTSETVQRNLLTLTRSNARAPVLPKLEGWVS